MNYETLSDAQLAAELLGTATGKRAKPAVRCGEPRANEVATLPPSPLLRHRLDAARELLKRELKTRMAGTPVMNSPELLRDWLRLRCDGLEREVFLGLFLDYQYRLIECETLFLGTLGQTSVYPREVVKAALAHNAAALAVAHNHPSGSTNPSRADEFLTQTLKSALALVDIRLIDHFVVGGDQVVSMAERGLL
jgi:DNA repair protein RadC